MEKQIRDYFSYIWNLVSQTANDTGLFIKEFRMDILLNFLSLVIYLALSYAVSIRLLNYPNIDNLLSPLGNWAGFVLLILILPFSFFFVRLIFWTPYKLYSVKKGEAEFGTWRDVNIVEEFFQDGEIFGSAVGIKFSSQKEKNIYPFAAEIAWISKDGSESIYKDEMPLKTNWIMGKKGLQHKSWEPGSLVASEDKIMYLAKVSGEKIMIEAKNKDNKPVDIVLEKNVYYRITALVHKSRNRHNAAIQGES